jgi:two-component system, OmpR family, phosphate regulon sensor histidine kinase PhoR
VPIDFTCAAGICGFNWLAEIRKNGMNAILKAGGNMEFVDAIPMPALIADAEGNVLRANEFARQAFRADPVGQGVAMFLRSPAIVQSLREAIVSRTTSSVTHTHRGAPERIYEVHLSPLQISANNSALVLITLRDTTREQQIERMRSDFVANASHELRTPLATLSGFIETMQGPAKDDPAAREKFLSVMKTQADRMSHLIDDLLSLSRIEISEHVVPEGDADLAAVTRQACSLLEQLSEEMQCELIVDLPDKLPVNGDAPELLQVIHNLIENALRYGSSGKKVEVAGRVESGSAIVSVTDYGPGIAAHHVPRLTERFYRVNVQDSRSRGGTGLGLAIVKHIVSRHRGRLTITSESGKGSCFMIALPYRNGQ